MVYQLLTTCRNSGAIGRSPRFAIANSSAIAITLLLTNTLAASATEYVFTAPPEVNRQIVEIPPARDTDYPLYECNAKTAAEADRALDAHDCSCTDCGDKLEEVELNRSQSTSTSTSKSKVEQP
jgi:hypothetical protein